MEQARRGGWELITCDLAIDTSTPAGEATASMMAVFSQLERRLISQRTREALAIKKSQGVRLGRPSGLPREVVERIISARTDGYSLRRIAAGLSADGIPTAQGVLIGILQRSKPSLKARMQLDWLSGSPCRSRHT